MYYEDTHCCGLQFLTGFEYQDDELKRENYHASRYLPFGVRPPDWKFRPYEIDAKFRHATPEEMKTAEARAETDYQREKKAREEIPPNHEGVSCLAILNGAQRKKNEPRLKKAGYKLLKRFYNPQHKSLLYMYFKDEFPKMTPDHKDFSKNYRITVLTEKIGYEGPGYEKVEKLPKKPTTKPRRPKAPK